MRPKGELKTYIIFVVMEHRITSTVADLAKTTIEKHFQSLARWEIIKLKEQYHAFRGS